jgi:hypothetical protein
MCCNLFHFQAGSDRSPRDLLPSAVQQQITQAARRFLRQVSEADERIKDERTEEIDEGISQICFLCLPLSLLILFVDSIAEHAAALEDSTQDDLQRLLE